MIEQDKLDEILEYLDSLRTADRLEYNDYSDLHDMVSKLTDNLADDDRAISLNAAIKATCKVCGVMSENEQGVKCQYYEDECREVESLKQLPSVIPQPCGDAISRKDAEKRIDEALSRVLVDSEGIGKKILSKLPSITPERPNGHWIMKHRNINKIEYHTGEDILTDETHTVKELIRYETDDPYCSECGKRAEDIAQDFCGYCGVRIIEEGEIDG